MITKTIQIQELTVDELTEKIAEKLLFKIENYLKQIAEKDDDVLLTRLEVADYLKVSLTTIHHWSKNGILEPLRIGNRVYYKRKTIIDNLEGKRFKRR